MCSARETFLLELERLSRKFDSLAPELELTVRDPELDLEGYVVVWNTEISIGGPLERSGKGGTRITPDLSLDEVKMLARSMALKMAAAGLPLGGAKSGIRGNPDDPNFERKYRRFVQLVKPILHENGGIFGGFGFDVGARPEQPRWVCDELGSTRSCTGKPLDLGGTDYDVEGLAGLGVAIAAKTLLESEARDVQALSFAVQGAGAMGAAVIKWFSSFGAKLRAVSDPIFGGTYLIDKDLPPDLLQSLSERNDKRSNELFVKNKFRKIDLDEILYEEVDVLFPCATQNVISATNAGRIKARYLVEGANNPTSAEAYSVLHERGIAVVPDFIANPGGVIAAFVELTSKISPEENMRTRKNVEDARALVIEKVSNSVNALLQVIGVHQVEPQMAAKYLALKKIIPS